MYICRCIAQYNARSVHVAACVRLYTRARVVCGVQYVQLEQYNTIATVDRRAKLMDSI